MHHAMRNPQKLKTKYTLWNSQLSYYVTHAVLFTNLECLILVLYCKSLITYRWKMDYLHSNGSFLVLKLTWTILLRLEYAL